MGRFQDSASLTAQDQASSARDAASPFGTKGSTKKPKKAAQTPLTAGSSKGKPGFFKGGGKGARGR